MATQRLDLKSARYDNLGQSVLIDGRGVTLEVSHEGLETLFNRELSDSEAVYAVVNDIKRFTRLAEVLPADDGKIHVTTNMLLSDGMFDQVNGGR